MIYDYWDNADRLSDEEYKEFMESTWHSLELPPIEDLIREKEEREAMEDAYLNLHSFSRIG